MKFFDRKDKGSRQPHDAKSQHRTKNPFSRFLE
jgi:hypothetical protein